MAIVKCNECGRDVSDKAFSCPGCGAPVESGSRSAPTRPVPSPPPLPIAPIEEILKYVNTRSNPTMARSVNGIGTTFGGYVSIRGYPNLGFVKCYICLFFFPVFPLGTYLVKDWDGSGGKFVGEISAENAGRFVSRTKQGVAVVVSAVVEFAVSVSDAGTAGSFATATGARYQSIAGEWRRPISK